MSKKPPKPKTPPVQPRQRGPMSPLAQEVADMERRMAEQQAATPLPLKRP